MYADTQLCIHNFYKQLMKSDADRFGPNDLPIPPSCLITVWADLSCKPKIRLRHPLSLQGIHCNTRKIYIIRFLETTITRGMSILQVKK